MKQFFKERIFYAILLCLGLILLELVTDWHYLILFGVGMLLVTLSIYIKQSFLNRLALGLGLLIVVLTIVLTRSFWLLTLTIFFSFFIFRGDQGHEMGNLSEAVLHPRSDLLGDYYGIQLVAPQSNQRTILEHSSLFNLRQEQPTTYEWDDINLVYFGGNSIIDLGNTIVPEGEHIVMVRKLYGRIRLIVPRDIGLSLNISLVTGRVLFERQDYSLTLENFRWRTPDYVKANRKLNLVVSSVIGDVEVIIL